MSVRHVVGIFVAAFVGFSACIQPGDAHSSGEEFTYLNMFRPKGVSDGHINTEEFINAKPSWDDSSRQSKHSKRRLHGAVRKSMRVQTPNKVMRQEAPGSSDIDENEDGPEDPPITMHRRKLKSEDAGNKRDDAGAKKKGEDESTEESSADQQPEAVKERGEDVSLGGSHAKAARSSHAFEGVGGKKDGEDIKRVSFMLMRLLKQYKAESMVDVPCRAHASWMHKFLVEVDREIPNFKYFCVDSNKEILQAVKARVKGKANAKFILRLFWDEKLPRADVVFSWGGLDKMKHENVEKMLRNIATADRHKYVIIGNHAKGSRVLAKKAKELNLRSAPFRLEKPMRVISKLSVDPVRKQMYLYKANEMKANWGEDTQ